MGRRAAVSVYVDNARIPFRDMLMCHLFADSKKELHDFAAKLHLHKYAYQRGEKLAHYQVSVRQRLTAIERGAQEVDVFWLRARKNSCEKEKTRKGSGASGLGPVAPVFLLLLMLACGGDPYTPPDDPFPVVIGL